MAKKAYIGINDVARKIKNGYVGVDGVARKIKKAYIGIGGVARPCWSSDVTFSYYGTITPLSQKTYSMAAAANSNYALFGGGYGSQSPPLNTVDIYDKSLSKISGVELSFQAYNLAATSIGDYVLFGGGTGYEYNDAVDAYDNFLTRTTPVTLSVEKACLAAASTPIYAMFGGGYSGYGENFGYENTVDVINKSLTSIFGVDFLNIKRYNLAAASVNNYILFGGGYCGGEEQCTALVEAYNSSLTKTIPDALNIAKDQLTATNTEQWAVFHSGQTAGYATPRAMDAYSTSLTRITIDADENYYISGTHTASTSKGDYIFISNGRGIIIFDNNLTMVMRVETHGILMEEMSAAAVGDYVLFGGGRESWSSSRPDTDRVDAIMIQ